MNIAKNMKLLAHHPLDGFGNCGEGMALQKTRDKRRVLFANPYLDGGGVRAARDKGRLWRDALGAPQTDAQAVSGAEHRA